MDPSEEGPASEGAWPDAATGPSAEEDDDLQRPLALAEKSEQSPPFGLVAELLDLVEANKSKKMKPTEKGRYKLDLIRRFFEVRFPSPPSVVSPQWVEDCAGLILSRAFWSGRTTETKWAWTCCPSFACLCQVRGPNTTPSPASMDEPKTS